MSSASPAHNTLFCCQMVSHSKDDPVTAEEFGLLRMSGYFSEEEIMALMLSEAVEKIESGAVHTRFDRFWLDALSNEECRHNFRFNKEDLYVLCTLLGLPENYRSAHNRIVWSGLDGLCVVLRRLAYPNRLGDLVPMFGRSVPEISEIFNCTLHDLHTRHAHRVSSINQSWVHHEEFAQAVYDKGAALKNVWAFVDGTVRRVCRPKIGQRELFSGHKRYHCVKYQHVMCPNGLVVHSFGPFHGRRHDSAMFRESGLEQLLRTVFDSQSNQLALYGDGGYMQRPWLFTPFRRTQINTPERQVYNTLMSNSRVSVEWGFGKVCSLFSFVNYYANQKVFLQPLGPYFTMATIFTNIHTCLYGSEVSKFFGVDPPTVEEYLM